MNRLVFFSSKLYEVHLFHSQFLHTEILTSCITASSPQTFPEQVRQGIYER